MIKIQIPKFGEKNAYHTKHSFFCNIRKSENLTNLMKSNFASAPFILPRQSHSNRCVVVDQESSKVQDCDALVTKSTNLVICVYVADCCPIIFADCKTQVIGVAHCGWRGIRAGIISSTISNLLKIGANKKEITVAIGPTISKQSYEVGRNFYQDFLEEESNKVFFTKTESGICFDLVGYAKSKILESGLQEDNIYDCKVDTYSNNGVASYRRSRGQNTKNDHTNICAIMLKSYQDTSKRYQDKNEDWLDMNVEKIRSNKVSLKYKEQGFFESDTNKLLESYETIIQDTKGPQYIQETEERQIIKKLKHGRINVEDTLDLHSMTEEQAYNALCTFLIKSSMAGLRYLLVVVGKGKGGTGVIKSNFKHWIESDIRFAKKVIMIKEALPEHGGAGAYYVFLRRSDNYKSID